MPTCLDCGSIVMEGDPYCTHCGAHLSWSSGEPQNNQRRELQTNEEKINDILRAMYLPISKRNALKEKALSFLSAKDCNSLSVHSFCNGYMFVFTRQNEYVQTRDEFYYDPKDDYDTRIFSDCQTSHYHDGLLESPQFKQLIKSTGLEFIGCRGGYVTEFIFWPEEFKMIDKIEVRVYFNVDDKRYRVYDLDLERMQLNNDYYEGERENG